MHKKYEDLLFKPRTNLSSVKHACKVQPDSSKHDSRGLILGGPFEYKWEREKQRNKANIKLEYQYHKPSSQCKYIH